MPMERSLFKRVACVAMIAAACWNIGSFTVTVFRLPAREANSPVGWQTAWEPILDKLRDADYRMGDLGYVTARSLRGEPRSEGEVTSWAELRYTVVPFNLVFDKRDAPFLIGDFAPERPAVLPDGLTMFFDSGHGLVLLRSTANPR